MYKDIGGYDMAYWEYTEMCREAWSERFNYLCIDITKNKNEVKYRILNESKSLHLERFPEKNPF